MNLTHVKINLLRILSGPGVAKMKNLRHNISTAVTMEHIVSNVIPALTKITEEIETRIKSLCDKEDYERLQTVMDGHITWVQCVEKCKAVLSKADTPPSSGSKVAVPPSKKQPRKEPSSTGSSSSKQQPPKEKSSSGSSEQPPKEKPGSGSSKPKKKKQNSKYVPPRVGTQFQVSTLPETGETHPSPPPPEKRPQHFEPTDEMRSAYEASINSAENNGAQKRKHNVHVTVPKRDTDTKRDTGLKSDTDAKHLEQRASKRAKKLQQQDRQMSPSSSSGRDVFTSRKQASHVTVEQAENLFQLNANGISEAKSIVPKGTRIQLAPDTLQILLGHGGSLFVGTIARWTAWIMVQSRAICWDLPQRTNSFPAAYWPSKLRSRMENGAFDKKLGVFEATLNYLAQCNRFDMSDFKPGFLSHCSIIDQQSPGFLPCGLIDEMTPRKLIRLIESFDRDYVPGSSQNELSTVWDGFTIGQYDKSDCHATFSGVEGAKAEGSNAECWLVVNKTIPKGGTAFITVDNDSETLQTFEHCYKMIQGLIEGRFPREIGMKVLVWYPKKLKKMAPPTKSDDECMHPATVTKIGRNYIEIDFDGEKRTEHPARVFIHPDEGRYSLSQTKFQREACNSLPNTYLDFEHRKQTAVRQNAISLLAQMCLRFFQCRKRLNVILSCTKDELETRRSAIYGGSNNLGWMQEVRYMLKCFETIIEKSFMCIEFKRWHRVDEQHKPEPLSTSLEFECVCNDMKKAIEMFYEHPWLAKRLDIYGKGVERGAQSDLNFAKTLLFVYRRVKDLTLLISKKDIPSPYSLIWYRPERRGKWVKIITLPETTFPNDGIVVYNIGKQQRDLIPVKYNDLKRMTSILFEEEYEANCWSYGTEHVLVESDEKLAPVNLNHYLTKEDIESFLKEKPNLQSIFHRCGFQINLPL